jgi:hypothetical protein
MQLPLWFYADVEGGATASLITDSICGDNIISDPFPP